MRLGQHVHFAGRLRFVVERHPNATAGRERVVADQAHEQSETEAQARHF
jgi:hypothetical protein